jgi:hypothetical protein
MTQPRKLTEGRVREYGCGIGVKIISHTVVLAHKGEVSGFRPGTSLSRPPIPLWSSSPIARRRTRWTI